MIINDISLMIDEIKNHSPLVHCITNYVTVNDVANALLAIGASPIMADDICEVKDIVSISSSLVINMGTLNSSTVESMLLAGKTANEKGIPVVFDPVGAGASAFRNETAKKIIENIKIAVLRGNLSEISSLAGLNVHTKGVDTANEDGKNNPIKVANIAAKKTGCVAAITGAVDTISNGEKTIQLHNGHSLLSRVTGTGCMTSGLIGAFAGSFDNKLYSTAAGVSCMAIAGEIAFEKCGSLGTGSYHIAIIDAISKITSSILFERIKLNEKCN